jgi:hypothetical protein
MLRYLKKDEKNHLLAASLLETAGVLLHMMLRGSESLFSDKASANNSSHSYLVGVQGASRLLTLPMMSYFFVMCLKFYFATIGLDCAQATIAASDHACERLNNTSKFTASVSIDGDTDIVIVIGVDDCASILPLHHMHTFSDVRQDQSHSAPLQNLLRYATLASLALMIKALVNESGVSKASLLLPQVVYAIVCLALLAYDNSMAIRRSSHCATERVEVVHLPPKIT